VGWRGGSHCHSSRGQWGREGERPAIGVGGSSVLGDWQNTGVLGLQGQGQHYVSGGIGTAIGVRGSRRSRWAGPRHVWWGSNQAIGDSNCWSAIRTPADKGHCTCTDLGTDRSAHAH